MEWAGEYYSQRLDRSKPLWEMVILELADGRWALVTKTHHCMVDGVGSVDLATTLLDTEAERPAPRNGGSNGQAHDSHPNTDETPRGGLRHTRLPDRQALHLRRQRGPADGPGRPARGRVRGRHGDAPKPRARGRSTARGRSPS